MEDRDAEQLEFALLGRLADTLASGLRPTEGKERAGRSGKPLDARQSAPRTREGGAGKGKGWTVRAARFGNRVLPVRRD